jgi:hypothetical protein
MRRAISNHLVIKSSGFLAPVPGILENSNLGGGRLTTVFSEEHIIGCIGIERWVKVNEIYASVRELLPVPKDVKVVPKE